MNSYEKSQKLEEAQDKHDDIDDLTIPLANNSPDKKSNNLGDGLMIRTDVGRNEHKKCDEDLMLSSNFDQKEKKTLQNSFLKFNDKIKIQSYLEQEKQYIQSKKQTLNLNPKPIGSEEQKLGTHQVSHFDGKGLSKPH